MIFKFLYPIVALMVSGSLLHQALAQAERRGAMTAAQWLQKERVRCLAYVDISDKAAENIRRTRELGFNTVLSGYPDVPAVQLMPLVNAADQYGVRVIWVNSMMDQFDNPGLQKTLAGDTRRFVGVDGRRSARSACPTDPIYWQAILLDRALPLARLAAEGHTSSVGLLLDIEDYSGVGDWYHYCYCNQDFGGFVQSIGQSEAMNLASAQRHQWLVARELLSRYYSFQDSAIVKILTDMRRKIDKIDPDFLFAIYPWYEVEREAQIKPSAPNVRWDLRLASGLGTKRAPFLFFIENTYIWGYDPAVEAGSAQLRARGLDFVAVTGLNVYPAERVWWPEQMALSAYHASVRSGGYWVFRGDLTFLLEKGEPLLPQIGGTGEQWRNELKRMNDIIEQTLSGNPPTEKMPAIPLPPRPADAPTFQSSDLFSYQHAEGSTLLNRQWTAMGLPWEGGEVALPANKPGEWFSFERDIRASDRYQISGWFTLGPDRGQVQLYVAGQPAGEPVDLYAPTVTPERFFPVGRPVLQSGRARLELRVVGKNSKSSGYVVGLSAIVVEQIGWWPKEWNVILPFDNTGEDQPGYHTVYPPERETQLDAIYTGKDGAPVQWRPVRAEENGYLNFQPLVADTRNNVAYALVYVYCPAPAFRKIFLGTDDGGKLWINDTFIWGEHAARSARRNGDSPMAYFNAGWNKILLKVTQVKLGWGLYFRIYDPENTLHYSPRPEK